jgi:hypothetical protein
VHTCTRNPLILGGFAMAKGNYRERREVKKPKKAKKGKGAAAK